MGRSGEPALVGRSGVLRGEDDRAVVALATGPRRGAGAAGRVIRGLGESGEDDVVGWPAVLPGLPLAAERAGRVAGGGVRADIRK